MTIYDRIQEALEEMKGKQPLYDRASRLNTSVEELIQEQLIAHLGEIDNQMPEYDTHDRTHSEKVLENIEKLLLDKGIGELSFLEALVLRLCCYFHDAGMILPQCYVPLMERLEKDPSEDPGDGVDAWLAANKKGYPDISKQFYCPDSASGFEDFLIEQLELYQKYCMGLPEKPENISETDYFREKRHEYLRSTHGDRVRVYSKNMSTKFLGALTGSGREDLQKAVGDICASHCWEIGEVKKLPVKLELQTSCPEMTCNVRYMAMLLRLGDVLHFSSDRVNQTVYAERNPMGEVSDRHWTVKLGDLSYTISTDKKDRKIAFDGSFEDPKSYYFLLDHLNWMDEELKNYAYFVSDMHGELDSARYALGLPTAVDRERVRAVGFEPDQDLKFKLEHQKIITLLMGMRLYRDEFMCLRELYQNALDACRCMRAENETKGLHGEPEIEFGLGSDDGGDYLYCKDQGTGMTMDIVKNYLLRIGNSYYQSAEFRRANAGWGGKVAPVSEFGIGLLSCYMIASRIEVITRHHTKTAEETIWISMESSDDYGYFKNPGRREKRWLGEHGTIVKLYLLDQFKSHVTDYLPDDPEDALYELDRQSEQEQKYNPFADSLFAQVQRFVRIPENGIPVLIRGAQEKRLALANCMNLYDLSEKLVKPWDEEHSSDGVQKPILNNRLEVVRKSIKKSEIMGYERINKLEVSNAELIKLLRQIKQLPCKVTHPTQKAEAYIGLHLPVTPEVNIPRALQVILDDTVAQSIGLTEDFMFRRYGVVYIDGLGVTSAGNSVSWFKGYRLLISSKEKQVSNERSVDLENGPIRYNYLGTIRPALTVDRGEIKSVSEELITLQLELHGMLLEEIANQVESHFQKYPKAMTEKSLRYIHRYLNGKFDVRSYLWLMIRLSQRVFKDYPMYGITQEKLLCGKEPCTLDFSRADSWKGSLLTWILGEAEYVAVNGTAVTVWNAPSQNVRWDSFDLRYGDSKIMIEADEWTGCYRQYDLVSNLWPLVPRCYFEKRIQREDAERIVALEGYNRLEDVASNSALTPTGKNSISDLILLLTEQSDKQRVHRGGSSIQMQEENERRYVVFAFVAPQPLTRKDEVFVTQYDHIPQYREGVEKGWSILFYNYHQGYVVAPGIVDRMEMLKLLPQEALEHDDGLEYYFTDGTFAF